VRDALALAADGLWAAFEFALIVPRQNGKGAVLECIELAFLVLFDARLVIHTAHEFKTAQEAFIRIRTVFESTPELFALVKRRSASSPGRRARAAGSPPT
jgi:phage terminase large subunit-like protein